MTLHGRRAWHRFILMALSINLLMLLGARGAAQSSATNEWEQLDVAVSRLAAQGKTSEALPAAQRMLQLASTPARRARSLNLLGALFRESGSPGDSERYLRESLAIREDIFGIDSLEYAETANELAVLLRPGRTAEALPLAERALATRSRANPPNQFAVAESLNTLGSVLGLSGNYRGAVERFEAARTIHESLVHTELTLGESGTLYMNLGSTYQRLGKYPQAEEVFEKGLEALRQMDESGAPYAVSALIHAQLKVDLGHYAEAEQLYAEFVPRVEKALSEGHPQFGVILNNRGYFYDMIGNPVAAEADHRRALRLKRQTGALPVAIASSLRNLAHVVYLRDRTEGEALLREALSTYAGMAAPPAYDHVAVLLGLAEAERDRGALADARATLELAREVARGGLGTDHPRYAAILRALGLIKAAAGDADGGRRDLEEALALREASLGPTHPELVPFLDNLAAWRAQHGDTQGALTLYRRSFAVRDQFLREVMAIGSESAKTAAAALLAEPISTLIAFQQRAPELPDARALAFEVGAQRKGRVLGQIRDWRQRLRRVGDAEINRKLDEWQHVLECRTSLTLSLGAQDLRPVTGGCGLEGTDLAGRYEQLLSDLRGAGGRDWVQQGKAAIDALTSRADALEAALNRAAVVRDARAALTVDTLSERLAPHELLLEFVAYADTEANPVVRRYGVFVLDSTRHLDWIELGPVSPVDTAVSDLLTATNDWSVAIRAGLPRATRTAEQTAEAALTDVATRVWRPLKDVIARHPQATTLRIVPDASLNLVPFEAFVGNGRLIDRFTVSYLPSARELLSQRSVATDGATPLVVVSPGLRASTTQARRVLRADGLPYLAEAAGEAADVKRLVPSASILSVTDATEQRVKNIHGPGFVHLVGHGVVLDEVDCDPRWCVRGLDLDRQANVMALSAILFEEAYGRGGRSTDDGMLTPLELQNIDLEGTEMLVLSQCRMASGLPSSGEGVYGMRRAASIAGARTFVAPLWNVADGVQRTLMRRFYRSLARGQSRADALRSAKLSVRRSPTTGSFLYWAPVILSGSTSPLPASWFRQAAEPAR